ncbi:MAG: pilus assembly protein PilP [Bacteroidia bacterium]|nr:pilus assembly protein PilP [Bacteroidia bacterium]
MFNNFKRKRGSGKKELSRTPKQNTTAAKPEKVEVKPQQVVIQEPPAVKEESYIYDPKGRRDPFVPLIKIAKRTPGKKGVVVGTLESYDIADFKLIAVINKEKGQYYALLLTPDNKSFTVKEGIVLGLNNGKIKKIASNNVVIEEYIRDYKGELRPRQVVLELHKGEGEE